MAQSLTDQLAQPEDPQLWTIESVSQDLEQHLLREAQMAQRLCKSARITLNPNAIKTMRQNLAKLEDKWEFFKPRADFLAEHRSLNDGLNFALDTLEQSIHQFAMGVQNSIALTELRQEAALKIEALQFQMEELSTQETQLSAEEMEELLEEFIAEYEALAEVFETLEEYGLNVKSLMNFYEDMSQKLEDLERFVEPFTSV